MTARWRAWPPVATLVATALALVFGLWRLGGPALTYDEGYTIGVVRGPFSHTWDRVTSFDTVQAPYYLLFSLWYRLGEDEWLLRLPSVVLFVAAVPLLYLLGRRLADARVGAVAAGLVALNGLALAWAQNARAYAMVLFLVTLLTYLLVDAVEAPHSSRRTLLYAAVAVVAVYAQFLVGLVVAAQFLSLLVLRPRPWRVVALAGGFIAGATVPAVLWVLTLRSDPLDYIERPSLRYLLSMLAGVTGGGRLQFFVIGPLAVLGVAVAWGWNRRRTGSVPAWKHAVPVFMLALPVAALVAVTYTLKPLLEPRYLLIVVPAFALVAANGLVALVDRRRPWGAVATVVVLAAALTGAVTHDSVDETRTGAPPPRW
jgi:mannosyltransferase